MMKICDRLTADEVFILYDIIKSKNIVDEKVIFQLYEDTNT